MDKKEGVNIKKYYVFYNFDNTPVDTIEGLDFDLKNHISEMNKKGFREEEVSYSKYKRIRDSMLPTRQISNFIRWNNNRNYSSNRNKLLNN